MFKYSLNQYTVDKLSLNNADSFTYSLKHNSQSYAIIAPKDNKHEKSRTKPT